MFEIKSFFFKNCSPPVEVKADRSSVIARFESAESRQVWTAKYVYTYRSRGGTLRKIV